MNRRKGDGLADSARRAAAGRRVVLSAGTLDGPFLAALAKVQDRLQPGAQPSAGSVVSVWGDGVQQTGGDDGAGSLS